MRRRSASPRAQCALAMVLAVLGATGCGGSSTSSPSPQPLSKTAYERRLGPLLNDKVAPAIRSALTNGGIADPRKLGAAIGSIKLAHDQMAAVVPPSAIADVHNRAVAALASIIDHLQKLRGAELGKDRSAARSALDHIKSDAMEIVGLGTQFSSRGF